MFDLFFIFSALFLITEFFYLAALRMQKIAADKVNNMECDPESTSVIIIFFFQNLTQYIIMHSPWNSEKKSVVWKHLYKIIY